MGSSRLIYPCPGWRVGCVCKHCFAYYLTFYANSCTYGKTK